MSDDPKDQKDAPAGMTDDLKESDRAMLSAISRRQRDSTPLSLEQERLLDSWIVGQLSSEEVDRAAQLTRSNRLAAERILERRLLAAADEGPDVPVALSARILGTSQPSPIQIAASVPRKAAYNEFPAAAYDERPGAPTALSARNLRASRPPRSAGVSNLRWSTRSVWQWSGLSAAAATIVAIAVFGFQAWQMQLRSNQSFQIATVTLDDRSVLLEGSRYRTTRGRRDQAASPDASSTKKPTEGHFRDIEVPTTLLQRAIQGASSDNGELEHSDLMSYLRTQTDSLDSRARIVIDSALSDVASKISTERGSTQIRVYDLDDPRSFPIRSKIKTLPADAPAIFLTLRP